MRPLNIESPVLGRKEKESLIEKNWPCHHLDFMFSWTFMGSPPPPPLFFLKNCFGQKNMLKIEFSRIFLILVCLHIVDLDQ